MVVDDWICEECLAESGIEEIDEQSIKWHSSDALVLKLGSISGNGADGVEDLLGWLAMENSSLWNAVQGTLETHSQHWIFIDRSFEGLD